MSAFLWMIVAVVVALIYRSFYYYMRLYYDIDLLLVLLRVKYRQAKYIKEHTTVADLWESRVDEFGSKAALVSADDGRQLSYAQADEVANRVANWALSEGLGRGHVVALLMENRIEYVAIWLGLAKIGVVSALINTHLRGPSLLHSIQVVRPSALIVGVECLSLVASIRAQLMDPVVFYAQSDIDTPTADLASATVASPARPSADSSSSSSLSASEIRVSIPRSSSSSPRSNSSHSSASSSSTSASIDHKDVLSRIGIDLSLNQDSSLTTSSSSPVRLSMWYFGSEVRNPLSAAPSCSASTSSAPVSSSFVSPPASIVAGFAHLDPRLAAASPLRPPRSLRAHMLPSDLLFYVFTSGTTGSMPKAAKIRHLRMLLAGPAFYFAHKITPQDRLYCPLPLYHSAAGMIAISLCWHGGLTFILRSRFSASQFFNDCVKYQATCVQYIGEICRYLLATPPSRYDRQHTVTKALGNGLRPEVWSQFKQRFGIDYIGEFYGSTEGNALLINNTNHVGACGYLPHLSSFVYPLRIVRYDPVTEQPVRDRNGRCIECDWGESGELLGRIDMRDATRQFDGYTSREATLSKILTDVFRKGDAWFRTGDLMRVDSDRFVYFVDRIGDTFRWRGENVSTSEVADILHSAPGVAEAVVYGVEVAHNEGRAGMASLVPADSQHFVLPAMFPWQQLFEHLQRTLPRYAQPLFIRLQSATDVTSTFKHRKVDLMKEGFDPATVRGGCPIYFRHDSSRTFVPVDSNCSAFLVKCYYKTFFKVINMNYL